MSSGHQKEKIVGKFSGTLLLSEYLTDSPLEILFGMTSVFNNGMVARVQQTFVPLL